MASYQEIFDLRQNQILLDKITVAIIIAADDVRTEPGVTTNHANRVVWSREAIKDPRRMAEAFMSMILAANKGAVASNIIAAPDTAIQSNVDDVVDYFADGSPVF